MLGNDAIKMYTNHSGWPLWSTVTSEKQNLQKGGIVHGLKELR